MRLRQEARQQAQREMPEEAADADFGMAAAMMAEAVAQQRTLEELANAAVKGSNQRQ